jgi:lysozyme
MLVGAYHFFRPKSDATAQALHFVRTVGSLRNRELPPVIDIEDNRLWEGITSDAAMKMVQRFCDVVRRDLGVEPIIYCSPSFVRDVLKHNAALAHFVLWLAHYTQAQQPNVPAPWTRWTFWQHSETGRVPGVSTNCDLNRFNGTPEQLAAMARRFTTALPLTTSVYHWWLWLLMRFRF